MKNKEKEIEEMSRDMCNCCREAVTNKECDLGGCDGVLLHAEALYNAGYRKASEIFEEIEKLMNKLDKRHIACGNPKQAWGVRSAMTELAELKKKYTNQN